MRMTATLFCVAAVLTLLPLCGAESDMIVPEEGMMDEFIQEAPGFSESVEVSEKDPFTSPMVMVEEEATDDEELENGEIQADVQAAMRHVVRNMMAKASHIAVKKAATEGKAQGLQADKLREYIKAAAHRAVKGVKSQLNTELVEEATKSEAIKVAKQRAHAAAAAAAGRGASPKEQAFAAQATASQVALSFANVARDTGLHIARAEADIQQHTALQLMESSLGGTEVSSSSASKDEQAVADAIATTARTGVAKGIKSAQEVATEESKKAGLSKAETKKLELEASKAVKQAAAELTHSEGETSVRSTGSTGSTGSTSGVGASGAGSVTDGDVADASEYADGATDQLDVNKARTEGVEKAKKSELAVYEAIAAEEKTKTRAALEAAAKLEAKAAATVSSVSTNSLARGLDKDLSAANLKRAARQATEASAQVEAAVKLAVTKALRQKDRLKAANEKVEKAGDDAGKEAEQKNEVGRRHNYAVKSAREATVKNNAREIQTKKEEANEAAHKAIARVVTSAGKKASRKAARTNAALIQQNFVQSACHRHAQRTMRLLGQKAKREVKERGFSLTAQLDAEERALRDAKAKVVNQTVGNTVRRQAHLSASNAKAEAAARGLSNTRQLDAARKAWKAAQPKITALCFPQAEDAASSEVSEPGQAPEAIDQTAFVVTAVQTMKKAVTSACTQATQPVVVDGARLAAEHDADYDFQVTEGIKEAYKVCNATVDLYIQNAEQMSKKMVSRSFDEASEAKQKSMAFAQNIRTNAEEKVKEAEDEAEMDTSERMNKQCVKKTQEATDLAKNRAARGAVSETSLQQAKSAATAESVKVKAEALLDGLEEATAKTLAQEAYDAVYADTLATAESATAGVAPSAPANVEDMEQLQMEWRTYKHKAHQRRTKAAQLSKSAAPSSQVQEHAARLQSEALDLDADADKLGRRLDMVQVRVAAREIAVPEELLSSEMLLSLPAEQKARKQRSLVHAIAVAVKSLHTLGGHLPSELSVIKLQNELQEAKARIAELEAASKEAK